MGRRHTNAWYFLSKLLLNKSFEETCGKNSRRKKPFKCQLFPTNGLMKFHMKSADE